MNDSISSTNQLLATSKFQTNSSMEEPPLSVRQRECQELINDENRLRQQFQNKMNEIQVMRNWLQTHSNSANCTDANRQKYEEAKKRCEKFQQEIVQTFSDIRAKRIRCVELLHQTIADIDQLLNDLINRDLKEWKCAQKYAGIGFPDLDAERLEIIQQRFEWLAEQIWKTRQHVDLLIHAIEQMPFQPGQDQHSVQIHQYLDNFSAKIKQQLHFVVAQAFMVTLQPPSVLKVGNKFGVEVRLLLGDKLGMLYQLPDVDMKIINEEDASKLKKAQVTPDQLQSAYNIMKVKSKLQYDSESKKFTCSLENIKLEAKKGSAKQQRRNAGKQGEAVTHLKYAFIFTTELKLADTQEALNVWTLSLPLVVTVHGTQDCASHGTIFWDYAFSTMDRMPFQVPDQIPWEMFAQRIQWKFQQMTETRRKFDPSDLRYIAEKLFGELKVHEIGDINRLEVTRDRLFNDSMEGSQLKFWEWFYRIMELIKQKLRDLWDDGLIKGFISKNEATSKLMQMNELSMLIRFSDSKPGCVSISFATRDDQTRGVFHLKPFDVHDLERLSLADRIVTCKELQDVKYFYPEIPKERLNDRLSSTVRNVLQQQDGYAMASLVMHVELPHSGGSGSSLNEDIKGIRWAHESPAPFSPAPLSNATTTGGYDDEVLSPGGDDVAGSSGGGTMPTVDDDLLDEILGNPDLQQWDPQFWQQFDQVVDFEHPKMEH